MKVECTSKVIRPNTLNNLQQQFILVASVTAGCILILLVLQNQILGCKLRNQMFVQDAMPKLNLIFSHFAPISSTHIHVLSFNT